MAINYRLILDAIRDEMRPLLSRGKVEVIYISQVHGPPPYLEAV